MARNGHPKDESEVRPRALLVRGDGDDADVTPVGAADAPLDSALLGADDEEESPFLRSQKRVPVRRGSLPRKTANRLKFVLAGAGVVLVVALTLVGIGRYGRNSWRFRLNSSDDIQLSGNENVSRNQVEAVFEADISRNMFFIPLEERKGRLEQIPWVESATVMRLLPNRLRVQIKERVPVAYAQVGTEIKFIDAVGMLMDPLPGNSYSFPVIVGFSGIEPLSTRAARMKIYQTLLHDFDSEGSNYSRDLDQVDLSEPDDVKIIVKDPQGTVLIHLGSVRDGKEFLARYKMYLSEVQQLRQSVPRLDSVDLRYLPQIVVNPGGTPAPPAITPVAEMTTPPARPVARPAPRTHAKPTASRPRKNR